MRQSTAPRAGLKPYTGSAAPRPPSLAARDGFERSYLAQAIVDVIAIGFGIVFVSTFAVGAGCAGLFLLLEICRAYSAG